MNDTDIRIVSKLSIYDQTKISKLNTIFASALPWSDLVVCVFQFSIWYDLNLQKSVIVIEK